MASTSFFCQNIVFFFSFLSVFEFLFCIRITDFAELQVSLAVVGEMRESFYRFDLKTLGFLDFEKYCSKKS